MAAVAVLRNETLQAFLQVGEKFEMLLKMCFNLFVTGRARNIDGACLLEQTTKQTCALNEALQLFYFTLNCGKLFLTLFYDMNLNLISGLFLVCFEKISSLLYYRME